MRGVRAVGAIAMMAAAAVVASMVLAAPRASAANAVQANVTALPFATYRDIAVDAGRGHVFVSGGDVVVVTDLDGNIVKTISAPGASGLALSADGATLYAALNATQAVATISTARLRVTARYGTGVLCPRDLALAQGRIWFSHECDGARVGFSSMQLDGRRPIVKQWGTNSFVAPKLAATQQWPDILLTGLVTEPLTTYDISGGDPVLRSTAGQGPRARDFALTTDGRQVVVAGDGHQVVDTWSLLPAGTYPTGSPNASQANAVAVGAGDRVAAGVADNTVGAADLFVFEPGASGPTWKFDFGGRGQLDDHLVEHGLAWGPDNSRVYAVTAQVDGSAPLLRVIIPATTTTTELTLNYLGPPIVGDPTGVQVHLGGKLSVLTGAPPGEQTLHVFRGDSFGKEQLPDVRTDADGNYEFHDTLRGPGLTNYTVFFDGFGDLGSSYKGLDLNL